MGSLTTNERTVSGTGCVFVLTASHFQKTCNCKFRFFLSSKVNSTARSKKYYIALSTNITYDTPIKPALISFRLENHYFPSIFHSSCVLEYLCINPQPHTVPLKCFLLSPVNIKSVITLMNGITPTEK